MIDLNTQATKSITALEIQAGQYVYIRHLSKAIKVKSVSYLDRGLTVVITPLRGNPIELGASDLAYLLKGDL